MHSSILAGMHPASLFYSICPCFSIKVLLYKGDCGARSSILREVALDPGDNKIISCAVEEKAGFIVTGDRALQRLVEYQSIKIVNAETFIRVLEEGSPQA